MKKYLLLISFNFLIFAQDSTYVIYDYIDVTEPWVTPEDIMFIIPEDVNTLVLEVWGARGTNGYSDTNPGLGGYVRGLFVDFNPGDTLYLNVGGMSGYNGGGWGYHSSYQW